MESETKKTYDAVRILRSLEFAYSIAPLSHGRRPFAFVTQICDYDVLVTAVFVFNDDGTLAGCLGEFYFRPYPESQHQRLVQPIIALFSTPTPPPPPPATGIHYVVEALDIKSKATAKRINCDIAEYVTLHHLMSHVSLTCTCFTSVLNVSLNLSLCVCACHFLPTAHRRSGKERQKTPRDENYTTGVAGAPEPLDPRALFPSQINRHVCRQHAP